MKIKGRFTKSLSVLVFFMIGIMAFVKGNIGQTLQIVVFLIWAIYLVSINFSTNFNKLKVYIKTRLNEEKVYSNIPVNNIKDEYINNVINTLLCENVTDKLTSVFPNSSWNFKDSATSFIDNGEATILTENADGYSQANISINKNQLDLLLIKTTSLNELKKEKIKTKDIEQTEDIDIYSWFINIGQQKLKEIAQNLASTDCNEFKIKEDGSVFIVVDNNETKTSTINSIPPKSQWNSIIPLIQDIGYLGYVQNNELVINL